MGTSDDRRPAAEAGRADGDVYLAVALGVDPVDPYEMAGNPSFRAAIDAARAPLLADIDQLKHGMAAWVRTRLDDALGQRDRALAELAEAMARVEHFTTQHNFVTDEALRLRAELAEVTRERDEARVRIKARDEVIDDLRAELDRARAKAVDGGEWTTEYRHRNAPGAAPLNWSKSGPTSIRVSADCRDNGCEQRRVWHGPAEPVADDGATP